MTILYLNNVKNYSSSLYLANCKLLNNKNTTILFVIYFEWLKIGLGDKIKFLSDFSVNLIFNLHRPWLDNLTTLGFAQILPWPSMYFGLLTFWLLKVNIGNWVIVCPKTFLERSDLTNKNKSNIAVSVLYMERNAIVFLHLKFTIIKWRHLL